MRSAASRFTLRSQPPVQNETPPPAPSFLTVALAGLNMLPLLPGMAPDTIVAPPAGPTLAYGEYMVRWMGCEECHGANLNGGGGGVVDSKIVTVAPGLTPCT